MRVVKSCLFVACCTSFVSASGPLEWFTGGSDTADQSGGLAVAVIIKQTEPGACEDSMFENTKFHQHLNRAVEIGLQTELLSGPPHPPEGSTMSYAEHQFGEDVRESLREVQAQGLPWTGVGGGETFSDFAAEDEENRRRHLKKVDDFCDDMCEEVHEDYYCVCACAEGRCQKRRRHSRRELEPEKEEDAGALRGPTKTEYNSHPGVMARFKKKYIKSFWEYVMAEEVAEEFMRRKTEKDDYACIDDDLDFQFFVTRTLHD